MNTLVLLFSSHPSSQYQPSSTSSEEVLRCDDANGVLTSGGGGAGDGGDQFLEGDDGGLMKGVVVDIKSSVSSVISCKVRTIEIEVVMDVSLAQPPIAMIDLHKLMHARLE
ncbi:hypothetical protein QVD17_38091 [Tagetes erecta]|uniref:Uncharacterized protein n=1 Tax=Tagetes erecta TaxID=13708 RepID=A0AAD8NKE0_TARER|nr:hypothetical protein QVD17_38091 [Tagetes erecta]